jgi:hypothetical protein
MIASLITDLSDPGYLLFHPWLLILFALQVWMFIDAINRQEWLWAVLIFFGFGLSAILYFFLIYRAAPAGTQGFELPGAGSRSRIKELQATGGRLFSKGRVCGGGEMLSRGPGARAQGYRCPGAFGTMPVATATPGRGEAAAGGGLP